MGELLFFLWTELGRHTEDCIFEAAYKSNSYLLQILLIYMCLYVFLEQPVLNDCKWEGKYLLLKLV